MTVRTTLVIPALDEAPVIATLVARRMPFNIGLSLGSAFLILLLFVAAPLSVIYATVVWFGTPR